MSARAGVVITGTEVLSGIIADANGPWLSQRLRERGVELAHVVIVGDRPADVRAALDFLAREGVDLVITSGGLGPTADDLTTEVVAEFAGRELALDEALEARIWAIVDRMRGLRWPTADEAAMRAGARKQAWVPRGATVLEPVGTAPGLVVPPGEGPAAPTVLVLPGPPRELQPMWEAALETEALRAALTGAGAFEQRIMRLYGLPEAELAATLRRLRDDGVRLDALEVTTCLRRGEIEIATVFPPDQEDAYGALEAGIRRHHGAQLFATRGETIDEIVGGLLAGGDGREPVTIAVAESCTGGLMAGRLTDRPGSSAYVLGGVVAYSNEAKVAFADVPPELIAAHGAVSPEVAGALADGARARFGAGAGIGITGVAGPGGGNEEKPVGTVCLDVAVPGDREARTVHLAGGRADVRERSTLVAMHMLRRLLLSAR